MALYLVLWYNVQHTTSSGAGFDLISFDRMTNGIRGLKLNPIIGLKSNPAPVPAGPTFLIKFE